MFFLVGLNIFLIGLRKEQKEMNINKLTWDVEDRAELEKEGTAINMIWRSWLSIFVFSILLGDFVMWE